MNKILTWVGLILFTGCARVFIVSVDVPSRTIAMTGNRWANSEDFQNTAINYCGGAADFVGMGQREGGAAYGGGLVRTLRENVYTYSCKK